MICHARRARDTQLRVETLPTAAQEGKGQISK